MIKAFKILFLALFALVSTQSAGQQQLFLNQTGGAPPTAGLLDQYKGAAFAAAPDVLLYSTYSATDDITGSLTNGQPGQWSVAVFRDFDDSIKSFTPAEVADGTANTWVQELGPSDGFVRRWYDQSVTVLDVSNLNHADQTDPTKMPKLFDSSTGLILENGKAALDFDGTDDWLTVNSVFTNDLNITAFAVVVSDAVNTNGYIYDNSNTTFHGGGYSHRFFPGGGFRVWAQNSFSGVTAGSTANGVQYLSTRISTGTTTETNTLYQDGVLTGSSTGSSLTRDAKLTTGIGKSELLGGALNGQIQKIIVYSFDQSANRSGIETAINNEYSIY